PSSGSIGFGQTGTEATGSARGAIGYISHSTCLYMDLTALENLRLYARLMNAPADDASLLGQIDMVGLRGRERDPVRNYSKGMQQRLAIARAFLHNPEIMLLDEPFAGLDQAGYDFLKNYLLRNRGGGKTCIMATHDIKLGHELADRLVVLEKGRAALDVASSTTSTDAFLDDYRRIAAGMSGNYP
ncbi:MAG TPA: ABC transporter ATP-binding protein, partial [Acidobacteriota bacterium]|nr:ABC transporter ATP-binding protein [Acidobacteriota bacterium]